MPSSQYSSFKAALKKEPPKIKPLVLLTWFRQNVGTEVLIILFSPFIYFPINSFIAMTSDFLFLF